jgi:protein associated with RNAse G/E
MEARVKVGDKIRVEAYKANGVCYRSWETIVEELDHEQLVTVSPAGSTVEDIKKGRWRTEHSLRAYYWFDKPYNLIEAFEPDGRLMEIYVNISSTPALREGAVTFIDHELDVSRFPPEPAKVHDEDEFAEAVIAFGYSEEFQCQAYTAVNQAVELANKWQARPAPEFGEIHD